MMKKKKLFLFVLSLFMSSGLFAQTILFSEDFDKGTSPTGQIPAGWDTTSYVTVDSSWIFYNPRNRTINTTTAANGFAIIDSDVSGMTQKADLITKTYDLSSNPNVTIQFEHYYNKYGSSEAKFYYSVDGGVTWDLYQSWDADSDNPETFSKDMSSLLGGQAQVKFKWYYKGTYAYYWAIDDFKIIAPADYSLDVSLGDTASVVSTGKSVDYEITVKNSGIQSDVYDLATSGAGTWTYAYFAEDGTTPITNLTVATGVTKKFIVRVTPNTSVIGYADIRTISITSQGDNSVSKEFTIYSTLYNDVYLNQTFADDFPPALWTVGKFQKSNYSGVDDVHSAYLVQSDLSASGEKLITPKLKVETDGALMFYAKTSSSTSDAVLQIMYTTDTTGGGTWDTLQDLGSFEDEFKFYNISLNSLAGTGNEYFFAFNVSGSTGTSYIDKIMSMPVVPIMPDTVLIVSPAENATMVANDASLIWKDNTTGGIPTSYRVYLGTSSGNYDLVNGAEISGKEYQYGSNFDYEQTYFWKIEPINGAGSPDLADCPEWEFTVMPDPVIYVVPYVQNFDAVTIPNLPFDWSFEKSYGSASVLTSTTYSSSEPNSAKIYNSGSSNKVLLIAPKIDNTIAFNELQVIFKARGADDIIIGYLTDRADPTTFVSLDTVTPPTSKFEKYKVKFESYVAGGDNPYIVLMHAASDTYSNIYIDDVIISKIPTTPVFSANPTELNMGKQRVGSTSKEKSIVISNIGINNLTINAASDITIAGTNASDFAVLTSGLAFPLNIAAEKDTIIKVTFTPTAEGAREAYLVIANNGPSTPDTVKLTGEAYELPAGMVEIGTDETYAKLPMNPYYKYSYSEQVFLQSELNTADKFITKLGFHFVNTSSSDIPNFSDDIKVYIGHTDSVNWTEDWITAEKMVEVFDGVLTINQKDQWVEITLDKPFYYNNTQNIVIGFDENTMGYHTNYDYFYCTATDTTMSAIYYSDGTNPDPEDPENPKSKNKYRSNIRIQFEEIDSYNVTFNITDGTNPIAGATVTFDGNIMQTDASGVAVFDHILPENDMSYTINATGFADSTATVSVVNADVTQDIVLKKLYTATFSVTDGTNPIENVEIAINGETISTGTDGKATIDLINGTYPYTATVYGFDDVTGSITIADAVLTEDITMVASTVDFTVTVQQNWGSNNPIEGASVTIVEGSNNFTGVTDADGKYVFTVVPATFTYTITKAGYVEATGSHELTTTANTLTVKLDEEKVNPYALNVAVAGDNATFTWNTLPPLTEGFEDNFPPDDWSTVVNNATSSWKQSGTVTLSDIEVVPAEGSKQAHLQWSYAHQDEWLITPAFMVKSGYNLKFSSFCGAQGSTHGDNYYVKVSTDNGTTWTELWNVVGSPLADTSQYVEKELDLSAYVGQEIKIAWQAVDGSGNDGLWFVWFIDKVSVGNASKTLSFDGKLRYVSKAVKSNPTISSLPYSRDGLSRPRSSNLQQTRALQSYTVQLDSETEITGITDSTYNFTGLSEGSHTAKVKAVYEGSETDFSTIDFFVKLVTGITLSETTHSMTVGEDFTLIATVTPDDAVNKDVTWTTSDATIATVDANGKVTAVKAGTATITATSVENPTVTATCDVTVIVPVTGITLSETTHSMTVGDDFTLTATIAPADATNKDVTWSSSDDAIATVDANGKVIAKQLGTATITATSVSNPSVNATCAVTIVMGVNDIANSQINVYPNPSNGVFNVDVNGNYDLQIIDATGRVIDTKEVSGSSTVELNATGVYFLRFSNEDTAPVLQKVIVQ